MTTSAHRSLAMPLGAAFVVAVLTTLLVVGSMSPGHASPSQDGAGETTEGTVVSNGAEHPYLLYTPPSLGDDRPAPLVVVVHGCQTTARQELELTRYNQLADRHGFVVVYPEVDAVSAALPGPLANCWKFFDPTTYLRGNGEVAAIAAVTRRAMTDRSIDPERVYLVGVSAGGLMSAASVVAYPELYTAVALVATAGYLDAPCFTTGIGLPVETNALLAHQQMGSRARVVPTMAIGSDGDAAFPATCTNKAVEQSLRINNLVLSGAQDGPLPLSPTTVTEATVPGGRSYTVGRFLDPDGCLAAERWIIHGMPHAWPGGADYGGYTDTSAPDGADATWSFLQRYRMSDTSLPCTDSIQPAAEPSEPTPNPPKPSTTPAPTSGDVSSESEATDPRLPATGSSHPSATAALVLVAALALTRVATAARRVVGEDG